MKYYFKVNWEVFQEILIHRFIPPFFGLKASFLQIMVNVQLNDVFMCIYPLISLKFFQNYGGGRISEAFGGIRHRAFSKYFNCRLLVVPHLLTTEELPLSFMKSSSSFTSSELNSLSRLILLSSGCLTFSTI